MRFLGLALALSLGTVSTTALAVPPSAPAPAPTVHAPPMSTSRPTAPPEQAPPEAPPASRETVAPKPIVVHAVAAPTHAEPVAAAAAPKTIAPDPSARRDAEGHFTPAAGKAAVLTTRRASDGTFTNVPRRNPDIRETGGGSTRFTVPVVGGTGNMRFHTNDATSFYEGGALADDQDWGGRVVIPQPYVQMLGKNYWQAPKIINVKPIFDTRTGKPITQSVALEIDGRIARYLPKDQAEPQKTLAEYSRTGWTRPGPLF